MRAYPAQLDSGDQIRSHLDDETRCRHGRRRERQRGEQGEEAVGDCPVRGSETTPEGRALHADLPPIRAPDARLAQSNSWETNLDPVQLDIRPARIH